MHIDCRDDLLARVLGTGALVNLLSLLKGVPLGGATSYVVVFTDDLLTVWWGTCLSRSHKCVGARCWYTSLPWYLTATCWDRVSVAGVLSLALP